MLNKLKAFYHDKNGFSYPFVALMILVFLIMILAVLEFWRVNIITTNIRDKFQEVIIAETTANYSRVFATTREGYAANQVWNGTTWAASSITTQNRIRNAILSSFSAGENQQLTINSIDYTVTPTSVAPSDKDGSVKYRLNGTINVIVPYGFLWNTLPPMAVTVRVSSEWRMMY